MTSANTSHSKLHSHEVQHRSLSPGDAVVAHFLHGSEEQPVLFSKRGIVQKVDQQHVTVLLTEDTPELGLLANRSAWGVPHRCWHPHPRVEKE